MIRFNHVIEKAIEILSVQVPLETIKPHFVRDMAGAITVILPDDCLAPDQRKSLACDLHHALGGYSPGERRVLLAESDLIDREDILESPYRVDDPDKPLRLIDRTHSNQEWVREPIVETLPIPTAAAFSIKGGVGRSTAVAAWAWGLARQGKRVLVVDLDLEAPGISSLLLDTLPKYGLVDWMVESLVQQADAALLDEMIQESPLSHECDGTIQVIPAHGGEETDYVTKLGRVYMPTADDDGTFHGVAHRVQTLLQAVSERQSPPEVVLLDARAGLHDMGAAVLSQLPNHSLSVRQKRGANMAGVPASVPASAALPPCAVGNAG